MNGAPTAKPPQFNPTSPLLEEAGSQPPTSRILRESKSTISRPRGWQGQPEVINFLRLPPPVCVYFRQRQQQTKLSFENVNVDFEYVLYFSRHCFLRHAIEGEAKTSPLSSPRG